MIYKILILKNAEDDLAWFRKHDRKSYIKCFDLVRALVENPREGIGKPERLKYFENEVYSRRINLEDRITKNQEIREKGFFVPPMQREGS